jgi:hypothetical protein
MATLGWPCSFSGVFAAIPVAVCPEIVPPFGVDRIGDSVAIAASFYLRYRPLEHVISRESGMRPKTTSIVGLAMLLVLFSTGCSVWRVVSCPELWGMSLPETWEYDLQRASGKSVQEARRAARQSVTMTKQQPEQNTTEDRE